jgi:putative DNA methylase
VAEEQSFPKRLIEVDLPIGRISVHARKEKAIRQGHLSSLHLWWARRPLAACRAVALAALLPDPADTACPDTFRRSAAEALAAFRERQGGRRRKLEDPQELRKALLDFIADFANWDLANDAAYLQLSRTLVAAAAEVASPGVDKPLVFDPFAGGGAIPLEALRIGADAYASDLNPVAVLLNKVVGEYVPRFRERLPDEVEKWGARVRVLLEKDVGTFYPKDEDGSQPIAYLWARTILCEGPGCGVQVPLIRSLCLAKRAGKSSGLRLKPNRAQKRIEFELVHDANSGIGEGTVKKGSALCPICGYTTANARVRGQLASKRGGARDARLIAVVTVRDGVQGRFYRLPCDKDVEAAERASRRLRELQEREPAGVQLVPDERIPPERPSPNARGLSAVTRMGVHTFGDLFAPRQALALVSLAKAITQVYRELREETPDLAEAVATLLAFALDKQADLGNSFCRWEPVAQCPRQLFGRQAIPIVWDFAESAPLGASSGSWSVFVEGITRALRNIGATWPAGHVELANAARHPLPDDCAAAVITDPPYYDAIPYADLSDFFFVWLRRSLREVHPSLFHETLTPKDEEAIWNPGRTHSVTGKRKDEAFYESQMASALAEARRVVRPDGIGVVVFAHKSTAGWEAILGALINAGWVVTASWPIDTENASRMNAMGTASLASSVHIVCRPREAVDGAMSRDAVGQWGTVLAALQRRIHEWMPRLASEGVVGADAIFACLGPALEEFSRYSRVERSSGECVPLREYLEQVWSVVSREALSSLFRDADLSGLEPDARLTSMWLWTLKPTSPAEEVTESALDLEDREDDSEDDEERPKEKTKPGFMLEFDAARKIAQGLGARLEELAHIVEVKGNKARLFAASERATFLFGKTEAVSNEKRVAKKRQISLFSDLDEAAKAQGWGEIGAPQPGSTTLDRVHQSMLLFGSGRGEALKRFLVEEGIGRQAQFWKLAQVLSALYPGGSDEKRWVDGVLARKKGLGFG